ncbi:MAG: BamA/TamA family outer membrane protein [Cytophagaceae bacterium]|jgi:outer membrane protein assembly factor BamA|nr:BamA/TamA family outer membrane protein [Cytophagaceae bacterium]
MRYAVRNKIVLWSICATVILLLYGCNAVKYVPDGERLLTKVKINNPKNDISKQELKQYVRQRENTKTFGFWKTYLGLYNLSGRDESKSINRWLRQIGEAPVVFDSTLVERSVDQMQLYLNNQGYYQANVENTIYYTSKKKAKVVYSVNAGQRYRISRMTYRVEDDSLREIIFADTLNSLLRTGRPFSVNIHNRERERIAHNLANNGYYGFSKEFIHFNVDSFPGKFLISDTMIVSKPVKKAETDPDYHSKYSYRQVIFQIGGEPQDLEISYQNHHLFTDTLTYMGYQIVYNRKLDFRPAVLINSIHFAPGDLYRSEMIDRTRLLLGGLRLFRYINIRFREIENSFDENGYRQIDCIIHLIQGNDKAYDITVEGTNSSGNLGAGGNFMFQHRNFFKGAELFTFNARMARQAQYVRDGGLFYTTEAGGDISVVFPKFIIPVLIQKFRQRYNPSTTLSLSYNYQDRPDYKRTIANAGMGYLWRSSREMTHSLSVIDFNLVKVPYINERFFENSGINPAYLRQIYSDHLILNTNYTVTYNQQVMGRNTDFWHIRYNVEAAGNLLNLISPLLMKPQAGGYYNMLGIRYAQYMRTEIDLRFHNRINRVSSLTYRFFGGIGIPYGNLDVLPFEKRFFSGGAYSLRAWPVRGVGPGFSKVENTRFFNQTADIKLEANIEYRFNLFWVLEGAFFLDAGNIWDLRLNTARERGLFRFSEFYKQIALGTGFGLRFDFKYFIFRLDPGIKLYDPASDAGKRWRPFSNFGGNDMTFNFAIGYPF